MGLKITTVPENLLLLKLGISNSLLQRQSNYWHSTVVSFNRPDHSITLKLYCILTNILTEAIKRKGLHLVDQCVIKVKVF